MIRIKGTGNILSILVSLKLLAAILLSADVVAAAARDQMVIWKDADDCSLKWLCLKRQ